MIHTILWAALLLTGSTALAQRYVATNGTDTGECLTWDTAASNIQWAINKADAGEKVWVSNGTYRLTNQITVTNGVILQSFLGRNVTIINGGYPDSTNRCLLVSNAVVDGFTITNGVFYASASASYGGGVYLATGTVVNCRITGNTSTNRGGGVYCVGGLLTNCEIIGNNGGTNYTSSSGGGGGIYFLSSGTLLDSTVADNLARSGGGVFFNAGGVISNAVIRGNWANSGGGVYNSSGGALLGQITIISNTALSSAGGTSCNQNMIISGNVTVAWNISKGSAGGISLSANTLQNVSVFSNTAWSDGGGIYSTGPSTARYCNVIGNRAGAFGGGIRTKNAGNLVDSCRISGNFASNYAGGLYLHSAGSIARNCLVNNNISSNSGGGVYLVNGRLENCAVVSNFISGVGGTQAGGVYLDTLNVTGTLVNTILYYNSAGIGAWSNYYHVGGSAKVGIYSNCCLAPALTGVSTNYSTNNITSDPQVVSHPAGDYRLTSGSRCVNAGLNQGWMDNAVDLDDHRRIDNFNRIVDIGSYEYIRRGVVFSSY